MFKNVDVLQSAMNVSTLTARVIANNVANASTPNFKASYVVPVVHSNPLRVEGKVVTDTKSSIGNDGNNVDVNAQMALLSENTIRYEVLTQLASMSFKRYSDVLKGV